MSKKKFIVTFSKPDDVNVSILSKKSIIKFATGIVKLEKVLRKWWEYAEGDEEYTTDKLVKFLKDIDKIFEEYFIF